MHVKCKVFTDFRSQERLAKSSSVSVCFVLFLLVCLVVCLFVFVFLKDAFLNLVLRTGG